MVAYIAFRFNSLNTETREKWIPVTTAWRVLRLRMEERPPGMEDNCKYTE
jgi:hypothetical protein